MSMCIDEQSYHAFLIVIVFEYLLDGWSGSIIAQKVSKVAKIRLT